MPVGGAVDKSGPGSVRDGPRYGAIVMSGLSLAGITRPPKPPGFCRHQAGALKPADLPSVSLAAGAKTSVAAWAARSPLPTWPPGATHIAPRTAAGYTPPVSLARWRVR